MMLLFYALSKVVLNHIQPSLVMQYKRDFCIYIMMLDPYKPLVGDINLDIAW